jgi:chloramphenicol 3-O-phosphotransferase
MSAELIVLSGPSASGKTCVALELQRILGGRWLFWEGDKMQPPVLWPGATVADDIAMTRANLRAIRAYVESGFSVIAELDVAGDRRALADEILGELRPYFVVLEAAPETLLARARRRCRSEGSPVDPDWVAWHATHLDWSTVRADLHLATDDVSPERAAGAIAARLRNLSST